MLEAHREAAFVHGVVMVPTQKDKVGQIGRAAVDPVHDVVGLDIAALGTAREPTPAVSGHQCTALSTVGQALGPSKIQDLAALGEQETAYRSVACQASARLGADGGAVVQMRLGAVGVEVDDDQGSLV